MGGGGGGSGGYFSGDPHSLDQLLRQAQTGTASAQFETEINAQLSEYLAELNDRDTEEHSRLLDQIFEAIDDAVEGHIDLKFGGSVAKHTYVDGLSDVDVLVRIERSELGDLSPEQAKQFIADLLRANCLDCEVRVGTLAVTLKQGGTEVQLLPALKIADTVHIADASGKQWGKIRPEGFTKKLTELNTENGEKLVPTVKLAKALLSTLPEKQRVTGYHAESLAVEVFKGYDGPKTLKQMLRTFFEGAAARVLSPIRDRTGQSLHVDDYLGKEGSFERRVVADAMGRLARKIANADSRQSIDEWKSLFEL